jgi:hypothetical protein
VFNQIRNQFINDMVKRFLGMTQETGVPMLSPELAFTIDPMQRPEFWSLLGGSLLQSSIASPGAGGAGFRSLVVIRNPSVHELLTLEQVEYENQSGGNVDLLVGLALATIVTVALATSRFLTGDTRRITAASGIAPTACNVQSQNGVNLGGGTPFSFRRNLVANSARVDLLERELEISPGWALVLFPSADNVTMVGNVNVWARTRNLFATEEKLD